MRKIYIKDTEVTDYIFNVPSINQSVSEYGNLMSIGEISIEGDKDFWNYNNPYSPMYHIDYKYLPIKIIEDTTNKTIYKGLLRDISINNENCQIKVTNQFDKIMNTFLPYYYTDQDTPANHIKNLLILYNIDYDSSFFTKADIIQNNAGLQTSIQITPSNNVTVGGLITELCKASISSVGFVNDKAIIYQYDPDNIPVVTYIIEDEYIFDINVNALSSPDFNGYNVLYSAGNMIKDGANMFNQLDFSYGKIVTLYNPSGAVWLGDNWIKYQNSLIKSINIELINELQMIQLGSILQLNSSDFGNDNYRVIGINSTDLSFICDMESI